MLTGKQERFVQNLVKGMSQREAYKDAYNAENMLDATIDSEACILFNSPKISARYKELVDMTAKHTIMTAQERLELLSAMARGEEKEHSIMIVDGCVKEVDAPISIKNRQSAIDLMNKMQGEYVTKIEGELKVNKLEDLI